MTLDVLGLTLIHFLWQGSLLAALAALALVALRGRSAQLRYLVCCAGMATMLLAPVVTLATLIWLRGSGGSDAAALTYPTSWSLSSSYWSGWSNRLAPLTPVVSMLWAGGVIALQGRALLFWLHARRLCRRGTRELSGDWQSTVRELRRRLRVTRSVRVVESTAATVPMMIGWLSPVVLLPSRAIERLTPEQLRTVIAHELAHVRRHDYAVNLVQILFEALLFYHPAVWWISHRIRIEREYCCDDEVVDASGNALGYARALYELEALRSGEPCAAVAATGGTLMDRISRLVGKRRDSRPDSIAWLAPFALILVLTTVGLTLAGDREEPVPEPAPPAPVVVEPVVLPTLPALPIPALAGLEPVVPIGIEPLAIAVDPVVGLEPVLAVPFATEPLFVERIEIEPLAVEPLANVAIAGIGLVEPDLVATRPVAFAPAIAGIRQTAPTPPAPPTAEAPASDESAPEAPSAETPVASPSPDDASVEEMRLRARQMMLELQRLLEQLQQLTGSREAR